MLTERKQNTNRVQTKHKSKLQRKMDVKEQTETAIEMLNALIVSVDTPARVASKCRTFRKVLLDFKSELKSVQMQINFDTTNTTSNATDIEKQSI